MKLRLILLFLTTTFISARAQQGFPFDNEIRDFKKQDSLQMPPKAFLGQSV